MLKSQRKHLRAPRTKATKFHNGYVLFVPRRAMLFPRVAAEKARG